MVFMPFVMVAMGFFILGCPGASAVILFVGAALTGMYHTIKVLSELSTL